MAQKRYFAVLRINSLDKTLLQSLFTLKLLDKALILPLMPEYGGPKMQFCDIMNKAGHQSKTKQASRGLSAQAELLVQTEVTSKNSQLPV